nr:sigma factor-like helix-turn-helix DNA-binding protein [Rhodospirillales bacterium]
RHLYDPARPVLPFLLGILRFRGADVLRRRRRTAANEVAVHDAGETFDPVTPNTPQDVTADHAKLREAIGRLPAYQRQALELMKLRGMSLQEASSATGMSITALKVATHRAIRSLRKRLGGDP